MAPKKLLTLPLVILLALGLASMGFAASLSPFAQGDGPNPPTESPYLDRSGALDRSAGVEASQPTIYHSPADFSEGFDDINNLPDWYMQNNSSPLGLTNWFQGNSAVFPAHAGAPTAYIAANYNNASGVGTISNWLLTPELALKNGDTFSFWTRTATGSAFPDRLQVRLSTAGASTNVGVAAEDMGDFTTLLLDINPTLAVGGYPEVWTQHIITLSGIPQGATGRIAFRYYVTNGGPSGSNSNYIGIDTVEYVQSPSNPAITLSKTVGTEPGVCATTDTITVVGGSEVYYCYQVENTGDVPFNWHDLVDSELGVILDNLPYTLLPGEFSPQVIVPETINATTVNTATWTASTPPFQATASDIALVNVLQPVLTVDPDALSSLQSTNSVVAKTLTIGNAGDPLTTLDWEIQEGIATAHLDSSTPRFQVGVTPAVEVVGDEPPDKVASLPSAIGLASAPFAPTDILYDNGPLVTHPGGGSGGADASAVQTTLGMNTYGFGNQVSAGNRVADDFTIAAPAGWRIDTITFFGYQTGSGTVSTFTAVNLRIWDGPPDNPASNVVFGDTITNRLINSTWANIYRVLDTSLTATYRPVMANTVSVGVSLPPGTYWLDWQADGTLGSGPWAPPISILGQTTTGNALQYVDDSGGWVPVVDTGTSTQQGFPFIIEGSSSPCGVDLPWVSVSPITGSIPGGETQLVDVVFDSTGLANGEYTGVLCVLSNDPLTPLVTVPVTMTVADVAYLEVAHLAPFAADPGAAVTITVDGAPLLTGFEYGDSTGYVTLHAGERLVEVYPQGSAVPVISAPVDLTVDMFYTAVAIGGANGWSLDLLALVDDNSAPAAGNFKLRLGHLAPFANTTPGTLADVRLQDGTILLNDIPYQAVAPNLELPAGAYDLKITTPDGALTLIDPLPVTFAAGDNFTAFATGDGVNQPLGVFAYPAGVPGDFLPLATYGVVLSPATTAKAGAPGVTVIYTLQLTNTSDVADTYGVTFSGNAWVVSVPDPGFEVGAGESAEVEVRVTIPASAQNGNMDVVTVQVSGTAGQTASSELTTTAVISQHKVFLPAIPQLYNAP